MTSAPSEYPDTSIATLGRDDLERLEVRDQARAARAATVVLQLPRVRPRSSRRTRHSSVAVGPRSPLGYNMQTSAGMPPVVAVGPRSPLGYNAR
jgi:hypothetical protein